MTTPFTHSALVIVLLISGLVACAPGERLCNSGSQSVARLWNEAALDAVRRDFPAPTVHARNLFHLSVAMWDTWAAFDDDAVGHMSNIAPPPGTDRDEAIAVAAYTVLSDRYQDAIGAQASMAQFEALAASLCLALDEPDPFGATIGQATLDLSRDDGSLEAARYVAPYEPSNPPLVLSEPGTEMADPNRWQPLEFVVAQTQNGQLLESNLQDYVGPHWGAVTPFAITPNGALTTLDPGPPPMFGTPSEEAFVAAATSVIRASSQLDPTDGAIIDIGPAERGNNPLGTNDGQGHQINPVTGEPYEPNIVLAADYYRVIAEHWADGPDSETPPGHWNAIANEVSDQLPALRIGGNGPEVDRLRWDVSLYLGLNGALHDAAIAAWGAKAKYDYSRPISMIRYLGQLNQLPLEAGLIEIITAESAALGERHEELADFVGETAIRSWARKPIWFADQYDTVRWVRAVDWLPYQRATFVTPAFPGYVSGHSTFSRAAAEVLTAMTGGEYFPDGLGTYTSEINSLDFDEGPAQPIQLQWATYFDAADEAGLSRIYGGIHVEADDVAGRIMGAEVGGQAWAKMLEYLPE